MAVTSWIALPASPKSWQFLKLKPCGMSIPAPTLSHAFTAACTGTRQGEQEGASLSSPCAQNNPLTATQYLGCNERTSVPRSALWSGKGTPGTWHMKPSKFCSAASQLSPEGQQDRNSSLSRCSPWEHPSLSPDCKEPAGNSFGITPRWHLLPYNWLNTS